MTVSVMHPSRLKIPLGDWPGLMLFLLDDGLRVLLAMGGLTRCLGG